MKRVLRLNSPVLGIGLSLLVAMSVIGCGGGGSNYGGGGGGSIPLSFPSLTLPNGVVGTVYGSNLLSASGGSTPYSWSISAGALPAGLAINSSTGGITGTPTAAGTANFTVKVTDSSSTPQSQSQALSITIYTALAITTTSLPNGVAGTAYSAAVGASGGTAPYTFSISSGSLPAWASLNSSTGAITGSSPAAGSTTFTVQVKDSSNPAQTKTQSLTLTVNTALTFAAVTLPGGTVGVAYNQTLGATGGVTPYAWSITAGALPSCLTLGGSTGTISGPPTAGCVGTANFTVTVTDSSSPVQTMSQALSIAIAAPSPLTITTTSLPDGTVGVAYNQTLGASGGVSPYTWSTSGPLPGCLSLTPGTGVISGNPVVSCEGFFGFVVTVTDSTTPTPLTKTANLSISISAPTVGCGSGNEAILSGQYAFELRGFNGPGAFLTYVGSLTLDGAGNIVGGEADANAPNATPQNYNVSGTYSVGSDNRGCASLSLNGGAVILSTRIVLGNISGGVATSGNIIEFDSASSHAFIASGPIIQQTTTTTPSAGDFASLNGTYVHVLSGWDSSGSGGRIVCAGIHTNIGATISNSQQDCNDNNGGSANLTSTGLVSGTVGSFSAPDANGRFQETIGSGGSTNQVVAYLNSAETKALVLTTTVNNANTIVLAGEATEQSNVAFNNGSLSGNFVIDQTGNGSLLGSAELGLLSANGALITGTVYDDQGGTWQAPLPISCGYTVASNGRIAVGTTGTNCNNPPIFYLTSPNTGVLISTDSGAGEGQMLSQTTPAGGFTASAVAGTYFGGTSDVVGQYAQSDNELVTLGGTGTNITGTIVDDSANTSGSIYDILESIVGNTIATTGMISAPWMSGTNVVGVAVDATHYVYVYNQGSGHPLIITFGPTT